MAKLAFVLACLMLFLGTACGAFVTCHKCIHYKYTSSDSSLSSLLSRISTLDNNCLNGGKDYQKEAEDSCFGDCYKELGSAILRYGTSRVTLEVAQRGCREDPPAYTCTSLTVDNVVDDYGFTVESEDVIGCYCDEDYCNHGNTMLPGMLAILLAVLLTLGIQWA